MAVNDEWKLTQYRPKDSDAAWFFRKNMTPRISPGDASYQYVGYLTFHFEPRDATGLPTKKDNDILYRIEEHEMGFLEDANLSVHIASVVKEGVKDHVFQYQTRISSLMKRLVSEISIPIITLNAKSCMIQIGHTMMTFPESGIIPYPIARRHHRFGLS